MPYYDFKDFSEVYGYARRLKDTAEFPPYVTFEVTSQCNLRCLMCPHTYMKRKPGHLDFSLFKKAVDEIAGFGSAIRFIGLSEPFLYPHIIEACEYVKSKGLLLHITNNGTVIQTRHMQSLIEMGLDSIIFSMQGLTKEEYSFMRNIDKYETIVAKIKQMHKLRGARAKPVIRVTTTITSRDESSSQQDFNDAHNQYCDAVQITGVTCFTRIQNDYGLNDVYSRINVEPPKRIEGSMRCLAPYYEMLINSAGNVSCCCDDGEERMVIGNAFRQGLKGIWDGDKAQSLRKMLDEGRLDEVSNCKNCVFRYDLGHDRIMQRTKAT